jgi:hypothetical protein
LYVDMNDVLQNAAVETTPVNTTNP